MKPRAFLVTLVMIVAFVMTGTAQNRKAPASVGVAVNTAHVRTVVPLPADLQGELDGVPYRIVVPTNWNGTLLVYAHGYAEGKNPPILAPAQTDGTGTPLMNTLLSKGFALAASQMAGSGWQVKEGMQNTLSLTTAFRDMVGKPQRTIIWGRSMGALMALGMIEKYPGIYDAAIALCPPAAGTPRRFDQALDIALAYSVAFDEWDPAWGTPGDLSDYFNSTARVKALVDKYAADQYKGKWEFIRRVNGIPDASFYPPADARLMAMVFATAVRAELEIRAGGAVAENVGRTYWLSDVDKSELAAMGVDWQHLLDQMNGNAVFGADRNARNYVEHYVDPSGRINRPVLTLHTEGDPIATPANEAAYNKTVNDQGNGDLLMQVFTKGVGHCTFTSAQELAAVTAMMAWLDTGNKPGASFFSAPGFDLAYKVPDWRW